MKKRLISLLCITFLIGSCAPITASPTQPPTATATQTVAPSRTPPPTQTAIPTASPYPPLQTDGPYLLFTYDKKIFTIMDADGSGRKHFQLPNGGYIWDLEQAVSPDGKWLAYFTGSAAEPYDLALNLLNLEDQVSLLVSNLIAPGFPENLEPVTETIWFTEFDADCSKDANCRLRAVEISFTEGIWRFDWSPDSQSIAFAAQIDGPSSDVYIYNLASKTMQRLTNEIENVGLMISWAPNGGKILYESTEPGIGYSYYYLHIADLKVRSSQNPASIEGGVFWHGEGWINENSYLISSGGEGAPPHNFRHINVDTHQAKDIWKFAAESFFIDTQREKIFMLSFPEGLSGLESEPDAGLYLVSFDGRYKKLTHEIYTPLHVRGPLDTFFALKMSSASSFNEMNELISIESDGTTTNLSRKIYYSNPPNTSPDGKWVLMASDKGTELYSERLHPVKSWDIYSSKMIWRPDSLGAFLFIKTEMYYLTIPSGEPILIEDCTPDYCPDMDFVWLP